MPIRQEPFVTSKYYHIYNRGVDRARVFRDSNDYGHLLSCFDYYRHLHCPVKFSTFCDAPTERVMSIRQEQESSGIQVCVLAYAFMNNHYHLLVRQEMDEGIHRFLFKSMNSFAKYCNTKHKRVGPLFQGNFQAVRIISDAQLLHVSRYIHLNPVVAGIMTLDSLETYPWTSYPQYIGKGKGWADSSQILGMIGSNEKYRSFVRDYVSDSQYIANIHDVALDFEML